MIQTVTFSDFCDAFSDTYKENFTYAGKRALFDYLEEYEESTGEEIELDIVALCCEYTEYEDVAECYDDYNDDRESNELSNEEMLEWLQDNTQVIEFDGGVIIQDF